MIIKREAEEVTTWCLAFWPHATNRWFDRLIPGRFKHVSAFAYSPRARTWVLIDTSVFCTQVTLLPATGPLAEAMLARMTEGSSVLRINARSQAGVRFPWPLVCTSAVASLVGLRGALLPDTLWRNCIKAGAEIVYENPQPASA